MSSNTTKVVASILAVAVVVIWFWYSGSRSNLPNNGNMAESAASARGNGVSAGEGVVGMDDDSYSSDMAAVDASISALDNDGSAVDAGLNDKPVSQTE